VAAEWATAKEMMSRKYLHLPLICVVLSYEQMRCLSEKDPFVVPLVTEGELVERFQDNITESRDIRDILELQASGRLAVEQSGRESEI
jgi:hypothetical protein